MSADSGQPEAELFDTSWRAASLAGLDADGQAFLQRAIDWTVPRLLSSEAEPGTEPAADHAAGCVRTLADLRTDAVTRSAMLIASLPEHEVTPPAEPGAKRVADPISVTFGPEVARLVLGVRALQRLAGIGRESTDRAAASRDQKEMQRKMLLAMAADLRIVLMRLVSSLQTLRWFARTRAAGAQEFARETLDLDAPLANRLGIWQIKWELEDLSFRFQEPARYVEIARSLEERRVEREAFVSEVAEQLRGVLARAGIAAEVSGRPKHIYSIWNKMRAKQLDFTRLYDLRALRIIVGSVRDCYAALSLVHELWTPVPEEFDDYIARPKSNGYRSLHTVVADAQGRAFEIQIRTREMHEYAEFGMAAHWHYKEAGSTAAASDYDRQISWMRQLLAWGADDSRTGVSVPVGGGPGAGGDRIYVLTPQARVIELPKGATPVDFAYALHTDLGHRCRGARIDGQMVSLNTRLSTGQTVEVVAAKSGGPSRDWLNPQLGYLASQRSRSKVRLWFNAIELQQRINQGQATVEKTLQRLGKTAVNLEQLAQQLGFAHADDLYVAVAKDEFSLRHIEAVFQAPVEAPPDDAPITRASRADSATHHTDSGVLVVGVGSLLTQLARCCRPAPPDTIAGFVTRGRGVSIHRKDCATYRAIAEREPERCIDVQWGAVDGTVYPVDIVVHAQDRPALLRDLSEVFSRLRLNVTGVNTQSRRSLANMVFTVEVHGGDDLRTALQALEDVAGVTAVTRR